MEKAAEARARGKVLDSPAYRELARASADATDGDRDGAVAQQLAQLRKLASAGAKRDLHLWSPALYAPGAKRGKDGVVHLSCLVMDYDAGVSINEATATWRPWFHLLHTTWSHTVELPRFRVILPLARPVFADDWEAVGVWAEQRTGHKIDPTGKSKASTFALPAVSADDAPCFSLTQPGELLDLQVEGVVQRLDNPSDQPFEAGDTSIVGGFAGKRYVQAPGVGGQGGTQGEVDDDPFEAQDFWDSFHAPPSRALPLAAAPARAPATAPAPVPAPAPARAAAARDEAAEEADSDVLIELRQLLGRVQRWSFVDALERLHALHQRGGLTDHEFALAKARLLDPGE